MPTRPRRRARATRASRFAPPLIALSGLLTLVACSDDATNPPEVGTVRGQVQRIYSDLAVAGAQVSLGGETTTTDASGRFQLGGLEQGEASLRVTAPDYQDLSRPVRIGDYQFLDLELTPVDTLVAITGQVRHLADGPVQATVVHPGGSLATDADGRWALAVVPIGPLALAVETGSYNVYATEVLVHSDGQQFVQTVTRDTTVTWFVQDDSYVYMRDDSLNANRGHRDVMLVTPELGRTALLSLDPPAIPYEWAAVVGGQLHLHGYLMPSEEFPEERQTLTLTVSALDAPFAEGAVDFFNRPGLHPIDAVTLEIGTEPVVPFDLDLAGLYASGPPLGTFGAAIGTTTPQGALVIIAREWDVDEERPHASLTYRF
jgi:hypothetical protein